jgi:mRNA-degrading endonuclease RelE of RelBE toxin-antitoxin system
VYKIFTANSKTEKRVLEYISLRSDIKRKLECLGFEPRRANGAHPLHGKLSGKWAAWLGENIRIIYSIDDTQKNHYC